MLSKLFEHSLRLPIVIFWLKFGHTGLRDVGEEVIQYLSSRVIAIVAKVLARAIAGLPWPLVSRIVNREHMAKVLSFIHDIGTIALINDLLCLLELLGAYGVEISRHDIDWCSTNIR